MSKSGPSLENHLLIASGVLATSLVAMVNGVNTQFWPNVLLYVGFAGVFVVTSYDEELGLAPRTASLGMLVMLALSVAALYANPGTLTLILSAVLMASVPYHLSPRQCWLMLAVANIAYVAVFELTWTSNNYVIPCISMLALQGFAITSSLTKQREVAAQEVLTRQNNELLAARAVLAQQSQAEERLRIAGDLHDTIGHQLTALGLQLEALSHQCPEELREKVANCQGLSTELLESIRGIVRQMSEERRDDLASAIARLASVTPGIEVTTRGTLPSPPSELTQQLVFCFQEAIHNAIRHGGATHIEITYADGAFRITDNGRGLRGAIVPGFGLDNIEKRLAPFAGRAALSAAENSGCSLTLTLPSLQGVRA